MPRNSNEQVGDGVISFLGQGRATHGTCVVQQWDNLDEIPGFTKSNHCKVCRKYVKSKRYHLPHTISFHLSEATQENIDTK